MKRAHWVIVLALVCLATSAIGCGEASRAEIEYALHEFQQAINGRDIDKLAGIYDAAYVGGYEDALRMWTTVMMTTFEYRTYYTGLEILEQTGKYTIVLARASIVAVDIPGAEPGSTTEYHLITFKKYAQWDLRIIAMRLATSLEAGFTV